MQELSSQEILMDTSGLNGAVNLNAIEAPSDTAVQAPDDTARLAEKNVPAIGESAAANNGQEFHRSLLAVYNDGVGALYNGFV